MVGKYILLTIFLSLCKINFIQFFKNCEDIKNSHTMAFYFAYYFVFKFLLQQVSNSLNTRYDQYHMYIYYHKHRILLNKYPQKGGSIQTFVFVRNVGYSYFLINHKSLTKLSNYHTVLQENL